MSEQSYAAMRQKRADRPAGGNFLGAKIVKGRTIDVKVLSIEERPGFRPPDAKPETVIDPDFYWSVEVVRGDVLPPNQIANPMLVKENSFMSDWLEDNHVADPVGKTFSLVVEPPYKGNVRFGIDRILA